MGKVVKVVVVLCFACAVAGITFLLMSYFNKTFNREYAIQCHILSDKLNRSLNISKVPELVLRHHPYLYSDAQNIPCYYKEHKWIICPLKHVKKRIKQYKILLRGMSFILFENNRSRYQGYQAVSIYAIEMPKINPQLENQVVSYFRQKEEQKEFVCNKQAVMLLGSAMSCMKRTTGMVCGEGE